MLALARGADLLHPMTPGPCEGGARAQQEDDADRDEDRSHDERGMVDAERNHASAATEEDQTEQQNAGEEGGDAEADQHIAQTSPPDVGELCIREVLVHAPRPP